VRRRSVEEFGGVFVEEDWCGVFEAC